MLIIDDEKGVCDFLSQSLKIAGYDPLVATEGQEGVEKALAFQPDLVLLDILMPIMTGWQVLDRLRKYERTQKIPIIVLTGQSDTETLLRCQ